MEENRTINTMNIAHYRAMLDRDLDRAQRTSIELLLARTLQADIPARSNS